MGRSDHVPTPAIAAAIDDAVARGDRRIFDLLCRHSGLPGPRPNLALALSAGRHIASLGRGADALVADLCSFDIRRAPPGSTTEILPIVAAMALCSRYVAGDRPAEALAGLRALAEDSRHAVRDAVVFALCELAAGDAMVSDLEAWTDGYLPAAVAIEALTTRRTLDQLRRPDGLVTILDQAFSLIENAARSEKRSQGYRTLLETLSVAPAKVTDRFPVALAWLEGRAATSSPELRAAIVRLMQLGTGHRRESLERALTKSAPPRRDPRTYVGPTRQRGAKRNRPR